LKSHETQSFAQNPLAAEAAEDKTQREHIDANRLSMLPVLALSLNFGDNGSRKVRGIATVFNLHGEPVTDGGPLAERLHVARGILKLQIDVPNFNRSTRDRHFQRV
jgi:hypothetical protein